MPHQPRGRGVPSGLREQGSEPPLQGQHTRLSPQAFSGAGFGGYSRPQHGKEFIAKVSEGWEGWAGRAVIIGIVHPSPVIFCFLWCFSRVANEGSLKANLSPSFSSWFSVYHWWTSGQKMLLASSTFFSASMMNNKNFCYINSCGWLQTLSSLKVKFQCLFNLTSASFNITKCKYYSYIG